METRALVPALEVQTPHLSETHERWGTRKINAFPIQSVGHPPMKRVDAIVGNHDPRWRKIGRSFRRIRYSAYCPGYFQAGYLKIGFSLKSEIAWSLAFDTRPFGPASIGRPFATGK